jgi:hypothetical protein
MGKTAVLVVLAATLGSTMLMHNAKTSAFEAEGRQADYQKKELAKEVARAGYNIALGKVKREFSAYQDLSDSPVTYNHGQYQITASGSDNEAIITSTGTYDNEEYTIQGTVERLYPLSAAVYIEGPSVTPDYYGDAFDVSGNDVTPPSECCRGDGGSPVQAVVAREGSAVTSLLDGLSHLQHDNVYGLADEDDIYQGVPHIDLRELLDDARTNADQTFEGDQHLNGNTTMGSADNPVVVVIKGDLQVNGDYSGYGMLLVEGDISLASGNFTWEGIVMGYGDDGIDVDVTGNAKLYGSLIVVPEQFGESAADDTVDFAVGGSARLQYSSEAIMRLAPKLTTLDDSRHVVLVREETF